MGKAILISCLLWGSFHAEAQSFDLWDDIRHSAVMENDSIKVRCEHTVSETAEHTILFKSDQGIVESPMRTVRDGPKTFEGTVPAPTEETGYFGFRLSDSDRTYAMPLHFRGDSMPTLGDLTLLNHDEKGDHVFDHDFLDITADFVAFSDDRLYYGIQNESGAFPVAEGFTFFSYLAALVNPDDPSENPTVYGLLYTVSQMGIISPGLYKISGPGLADMLKLGEVETQIYERDHLLVLSCSLEDLRSDRDFSSWYDPQNPKISAIAITQKITLTEGVQEADTSDGASIYLRVFQIAPFVNERPRLTDPRLSDLSGEGFLEVDYFDANAHFPLTAEVVLDDNQSNRYPLFPSTLDYSQSVTYRTAEDDPLLSSGNWTKALFRFSDNNIDYIELSFEKTTGFTSSVESLPQAPVLYPNYPNPFNLATAIAYDVPHPRDVTLTIYTLMGQKVDVLVDGRQEAGHYAVRFDGLGYANGIYLYRLEAGSFVETRRMVLIK